ncbi:splicing factor, arginine/serine-rich 15 [Silurus meridionalis]|nr:splicing factor, arginine/serine-rich 15 [Silurus meridionalis]
MDSKPPISRAKMISITKSAIKAIKLYKHVVQIVEKFIKKCKPEYKVPGLYVVDSIVRQSRHQFGADKDVFGPRFTKNITGTFENLCLCPTEDRSKIVRVLNLWQKNGVFKIEVIQPLLDMAAGSSSSGPVPGVDNGPVASPSSPVREAESHTAVPVNSVQAPVATLQNSDAFAAVAQLFQSSQGQQLQQMLQTFQQPGKPQSPALENNMLTHLQIQASIQPPTGLTQSHIHTTQPAEKKATFDKKILDRFDYDDEPEGGEETKKDEASTVQPAFAFGEGVQIPQQTSVVFSQAPSQMQQFQQQMMGMSQEQQEVPGELDTRQHQDGGRTRSRSGSRSPKRRRSRSGSRSRRFRHRRSRSRSRERRRHSPRSRSQERREREKERERRQKGLPPIKPDTLSVCSTTLWVGQLDKRTQQQDVACLLEEFGQIESINMIPPRGCAYIVMVHRQDAFRALQKLSRGTYKVNQKAIKIAWALNKGIKSEFKQYWDVELGVSYVPWSKAKMEDLEVFREGGMLDTDTLSPEWKGVQGELETSDDAPQNGRGDVGQMEESPALLPVQAAPVQPVGPSGPVGVPPPGFPASMNIPPPSFPPGVPPPPGPFMRPGFNPMQIPPGFLPPGGMPLIGTAGPPLPTAGIGIPPVGSSVEDLSGDPGGMGSRISRDGVDSFNTGPGNPVPPVPPPGMNMQNPPGLLGTRPGSMPLQRPPGMPPPPHLQRFSMPPPRPGMPPMPHQMMPPRGPPQMMHREPPPGSFGMPPPPSHVIRAPFPPPGPPFRGERNREQERFGGRRQFGGERSEGRERFGGWHEEPESRGGWERAGSRRDWRSPDGEREREREPGRDEERGKRRDRERSTRWDRDDRLDKLEPNGHEMLRDSSSREGHKDSTNEIPHAKAEAPAPSKEGSAEKENQSQPAEQKQADES